MASIIKRKKQDGSVSYQVQIRVRGECPAVSSFETEEEARKFIANVEPKLQRQAKRVMKVLRRERERDSRYAEFLDMRLKDLPLTFGAVARREGSWCADRSSKSAQVFPQHLSGTT